MIRLSNIRWGLAWALGYIAFYCVVAMIMNAVSNGEAYASKGITLPQVLGVYVVCGLIGGLILGTLRPLTKTKTGATVVGVIVAVPIFMGIGVLRSGPPWLWDDTTWVPIGIVSLILGAFGAEISWSKPAHE